MNCEHCGELTQCDIINCTIIHNCPPGTNCYKLHSKESKKEYYVLGVLLGFLIAGEAFVLFTIQPEIKFIETVVIACTTLTVITSPLLLYYSRKK